MTTLTPRQTTKFCVKCGSRLKLTDNKYFICTSCGHHQYLNPIPTNGVIIENEKGEILLVKRAIDPKKGWWDVPGGFIEPGESLEKSVYREIKEELGLSIIKNSIKTVGIYSDTYDYMSVRESTLTIIVSARVVEAKIVPQDDVCAFKFVIKEKILSEKIAFSAVKSGIKDYLRLCLY